MNTAAGEWVENYLQHLAGERRLSPHTKKAYRRDLKSLCDQRLPMVAGTGGKVGVTV